MVMIETLNSIFQGEKEILKRESTIANEKYLKIVSKMEELEKEAKAKSIRFASISENENKYLASLIKNGVPQCPRCIVRSNNFHDMATLPSDDTHDRFRCKTCGLDIEFET